MPARPRCARGARAGSARWCWPSRPMPVEPTPRPRACSPKASRRSGSTACPGAKPRCNCASASTFLRRSEGDEWPDLSDEALARERRRLARAAADGQDRAGADLAPTNLSDALTSSSCRGICAAGSTTRRRRISTAPTGSRVPIDYEAEQGPKLSIRVQELFGLDRSIRRSPAAACRWSIELLSPAHRPVQVTRDLPGFWRGSYAAVKAEMRGRYPRHPWPDDPSRRRPTRRAKPRGPDRLKFEQPVAPFITTSPERLPSGLSGIKDRSLRARVMRPS